MNYFGLINLWDPTHISGWLTIAITALLLGLVHGITPDEHTWPITFSYAIGSYSTKKGLRAGLIFSVAFTIQRALASELAYLGLSRLYTFANINYLIYIIVGFIMLLAGLMIVKKKTIFHFELPFLKEHHLNDQSDNNTNLFSDPRPWMPAVHGFVAGWGFGAFAIIIYTILAPATHSALWAWVPGALFGIGTMIMQAMAGMLFGYIASKRGLSPQAIRRVALKTAANTLTYGGLAFILGGVFGQLFPSLAGLSFVTGLHIHNLYNLGIAFFLVIFSVLLVGSITLVHQTRREIKNLA
jgi:MFS family permease